MPVRPLGKQKKKDTFGELSWDYAKRNKLIENSTETTVFNLTQKEFEKCRFSLPDKNTRMIECQVHTKNFTHGYRLFPPHLWDLREGVIYKRNDKGEFEKWSPNFKNNVKLIEESKKDLTLDKQ